MQCLCLPYHHEKQKKIKLLCGSQIGTCTTCNHFVTTITQIQFTFNLNLYFFLYTLTGCPEVECPLSCTKVVNALTGCPKCFCKNMNFSCPPEPLCPQDCSKTSIVFNETVGCKECKCEM